jgi:stage II sporulation protein M
MKNKVKKEVDNKRVKNFFRENYSKSWEYIKESKNFIWAAVVIFFIAVIIGFLYQPPAIIKIILDNINTILAKTQGMNSLELISFIFLNNLQIGFMGLIYGFALGIFPILSIFVNGYVVGYVSSSAVASSGAGTLLNLIPHGIFELPAIFISFGMGIKFGSFLFYKQKMKHFSELFIKSLRVFVFVVIPLLIIAAIIEGTLISFIK